MSGRRVARKSDVDEREVGVVQDTFEDCRTGGRNSPEGEVCPGLERKGGRRNKSLNEWDSGGTVRLQRVEECGRLQVHEVSSPEQEYRKGGEETNVSRLEQVEQSARGDGRLAGRKG